MVGKKKPEVNYSKVRLESFKEGKSVQIMHIGPYDQEAENLKKMENFATAQGLNFTDKHHEIYMSDPRRTSPEKLKTVIRHPVN
ncbi:MAG TPA: GyrI-like domain-containing protein [Candidatus Dojkabacteria bacterium]|nr:GyrI-like domain-containing protein [Candidatus Dojkabacteria bacterium]